MNKNYTHFYNDKEKMIDFFGLSKEEFLESYSYLTDEEYELTRKYVIDKYIEDMDTTLRGE